MNADRLLAHYEQIADAPDAIARLRRFILDLAVRGKLVPQDANDEPASELLKRIAKEKARLVKAGEIKNKPLSPVDEDADFEVPPTWRWTRLGTVTSYIQRGKSPKYAVSDGSLVVSQKCVQWSGLDLSVAKQVTLESLGDYEDIRFLRDGDLLWNSTGTGTIGRIIRLADPPEKLVCDSHVTVVRCLEVVPEYIRTWLRSDHVYALIEDRAAGSTNQVELTAQMAINQVVPLPPLAEQRRIVAKVDELLGLCDRLEAARAGREAVRDQMAAASLARLNAPDPETFPEDARFALDALSALTTRPDQIKRLRQTILNLAVRGKLVPQDPNDEPASELLKRIAKEWSETVARRKIRGAVSPQAPSAELEGFDLPASWQLCALGQVSLITDPNPSHRYPEYSGGTVPILSTREFEGEGGWNSATAKLTTRAFWEFQTETCDFAEGDIIFARKGRLGLPRFLPPLEKFTFSHTLFAIKPMDGLNPLYLLWLLRRDEVVTWLTNDMNQNTGVPTLGKAKTERLPIPLPPLAEQHRIVAKVDALMALCDQLEASLTTTATTRRRLLDTLLAEALAPVDAREMEDAG